MKMIPFNEHAHIEMKCFDSFLGYCGIFQITEHAELCRWKRSHPCAVSEFVIMRHVLCFFSHTVNYMKSKLISLGKSFL